MKSKIIYLAISIMLLTVVRALGQEELDGYLITAAGNNPGLKVKFNRYMAALEVGPQVSALPDPKFAFAWFIRPVETRVGPQNVKLSLTQMFPWFGTLSARNDVAVQQAKAKYELFEEARSKLYYDVKATYYELYFIKKATGILKENIAILETFNKLALIKIEAGMVSAVDELRIRMEIGDLENRLALLRDSYFAKLVAFNNLLNVEANSTVNIPDELWDENIAGERKAILDSIKINNHRLLSNDFEYESFLSKEQSARRTGMPNISIGVDYIFTGKSDNPVPEPAESGRNAVIFPKIGITIPIYRKKYNAMINEAGYLQNVATETKADNLNKLETLLEKIIKDYNDAKRRYELYERQTELARQALQLLQSEYSTGETDFAELLRIERKLLNYALELQRARTDKNVAVAFVEYLMGK